jgi:hypothetical protein
LALDEEHFCLSYIINIDYQAYYRIEIFLDLELLSAGESSNFRFDKRDFLALDEEHFCLSYIINIDYQAYYRIEISIT